jgi:hypothetical protein
MDASCYSDSDRVAIVNNNNSNINVIVYGNCDATYRNHSRHGTPCHNLGCWNNIPDVSVPLFISVRGRHELGAAYNNNNNSNNNNNNKKQCRLQLMTLQVRSHQLEQYQVERAQVERAQVERRGPFQLMTLQAWSHHAKTVPPQGPKQSESCR